MEDENAIIEGAPTAAPESTPRIGPDGELIEGPAPEDLIDIELDGQVYQAPAALKGAFLRQADYTRKTQELAEHRRALEAERQTVAELARSARGEMSDRAHLMALEQQLDAFQGLDWDALASADAPRARVLWEQFQKTQKVHEEFAYAVDHHEQRAQLQSAREAADRMAEAGRKLSQEIEGWSPEVAAKLVDYAQAFGVTLDELREAADPRLWKILHRAYQADAAGQRDAAAQAQSVRPAVTVAGAAPGGGAVRDELATKEWMRRRNDQMMKGR